MAPTLLELPDFDSVLAIAPDVEPGFDDVSVGDEVGEGDENGGGVVTPELLPVEVEEACELLLVELVDGVELTFALSTGSPVVVGIVGLAAELEVSESVFAALAT
ncbi:hypothetical protein IFR05_015931 [Cadophora sp. M221]|nr:hypothetical protein IFR05_015931 [Cadophora sp. M221]